MDSRIRNIVIIVISILVVSCKKKSACMHSYGENTTVIIPTGEYKKITASGDFDINLIKSDEHKVEIVGGKNSAEFVGLKNEDKVLTISNENKCNWLRSYKKKLQINLYFENLNEIRSTGESYIYSEKSLPIDTLFVHITGVGDVDVSLDKTTYLWAEMYELGDLQLSGTVTTFVCNVTRFGNLKAKELRADNMFIEASNEGDAHIYPLEFTKATCSNIGNIFHYNKGSEVEVIETGKGRYLEGK